MKTKIRKTGEIVDIICYNCSTIRSHQDYVSYIDTKGIEHDRESLNYYWDFEPIETDTDKNWQDVRERAAIAAMQGMLANPENIDDFGDYKWLKDVIAHKVLFYSNALIEELKKK